MNPADGTGKTASEFLHNLEAQHKTFQDAYDATTKELANLEQQEIDADDSIALLEDDIHAIFEEAVPNILEYKALKADLLLTLDGLKEIEQAIAAKKAFIEKTSEGLAKSELGIKAMKKHLSRTGTVIPFRKDT
jgi:chromosome segregation ATPase